MSEAQVAMIHPRVRMWIVAAIGAGCAMSCRPTGTVGEEASDVRSPRTGVEHGGLPGCGDAAPGAPRLESYADVQIPATYWVDMTFDGGEWRPAAPIAMPHHHATRLVLTDVTDFAALADHQGERVRFTVEVTSREIHQVVGRRAWRATYYARILAACIADRGS